MSEIARDLAVIWAMVTFLATTMAVIGAMTDGCDPKWILFALLWPVTVIVAPLWVLASRHLTEEARLRRRLGRLQKQRVLAHLREQIRQEEEREWERLLADEP